MELTHTRHDGIIRAVVRRTRHEAVFQRDLST
jgi:hypothetical protein